MTKLNLGQMEADRKAGTPGEWVTGPLSKTQVSSNAEPSSVCSTGGWSDPRIDADVQQDMQLANARRIARVPQLESMVSDMVEATASLIEAIESSRTWEEIDAALEHARAMLAKHVGEA